MRNVSQIQRGSGSYGLLLQVARLSRSPSAALYQTIAKSCSTPHLPF